MRTGVGVEIAVARTVSGKTAKQVSRETGIHESDISRIERGRLNPTESELERLRQAVGWTPLVSFFVKALHEGSTMLRTSSEVVEKVAS